MFTRTSVSGDDSWDKRETDSTTVGSFDRNSATTSTFGDTEITSDAGEAIYLIEEGSTNKILTEDLYQILLGYLKNWKQVTTRLMSWVRRNFTES